MSGERFQTGDTEESYESPFQQISASDPYSLDQNTTIRVPSSRSFTEIGGGEISLSRNSLRLSVPIDFVLFGNKYSIKDFMNYDSGTLRRSFSVVAADRSSLRTDISIRSVRNMSLDRQPQISLKIESVNVGNSINAILTLDPNRALNNKDIDDMQRVFNNIRNTQVERFVKALPSFDSLGPINPKSILMNPKILLGVILNRKGFQNVSQLSELETLEVSTVDKVMSGLGCVGTAGGTVLGTLAALPSVGGAVAVGGFGALATASTCYDAYQKIFQEDKTATKVPIQPPPPTPPPSGRCDPSVQSCPPVLPPPCDPTIQSCPPIGPPPPPPKPKVIPIPPEKIRWVQTILKVANGESELVVDGLFGPKTHAAIKRFQLGFKLLANGAINQETTNALIQLGLNHIARQSRLAVDGKMGPKTISEIKSFQSTHDSGPVDGIVGPITRAAMVKELLSSVPVLVSREMTEGWY